VTVSRKLRIGFLGAGRMGQLAHIRSYALLHEECELVALAEPRPRTAELVAARYGIGRVFRDHRELLESVEVDGLVAPQPFLHHLTLLPELYPHVRNLFTEKPLALAPATGDRLAELAREHGCVHMLGYHRRSDPATREARRTVESWRESGELGGLRYLRICYSDGDWIGNVQDEYIETDERPPPFAAEEVDGDDETVWALHDSTDKLVHPLNLLRHFLGEPYRVDYVHRSGRLIALESESGIPASIEVTPYRRTVGFDEELLVAFERGYVKLRVAPALARNRAGTVEIYRDLGNGANPETVRPELRWVEPMRAQAADFLRVCRGEAPPPTGVGEAALDLHLVGEIVNRRLAQPGGRDGIQAERSERARVWNERVNPTPTG
jgi:predicted dehydrogenase